MCGVGQPQGSAIVFSGVKLAQPVADLPTVLRSLLELRNLKKIMVYLLHKGILSIQPLSENTIRSQQARQNIQYIS